MAIRYVGTDIIRDYRGFTIIKSRNICKETYYWVNELQKNFCTLKEAKIAIDIHIRCYGE